MPANSTTVILTHGAWADGSSWGKVILPLERHGLRVIAAPIPLTSLTDDVAALGRAIERTRGPVTLAAHAYAGGVISAVKHERIRSLVYVAALTPDKGETVVTYSIAESRTRRPRNWRPTPTASSGCRNTASAMRSRKTLPPTRLRSWLPRSGRSLCRAFRNRRPSRLGKRSPRGSCWRKKTG